MCQIQFNVCKGLRNKIHNKHWYEHVPEILETSIEGKISVLWNQQAQTDGTILNNVIICEMKK